MSKDFYSLFIEVNNAQNRTIKDFETLLRYAREPRELVSLVSFKKFFYSEKSFIEALQKKMKRTKGWNIDQINRLIAEFPEGPIREWAEEKATQFRRLL